MENKQNEPEISNLVKQIKILNKKNNELTEGIDELNEKVDILTKQNTILITK